jgi:hypothetical protein
MKTVPEVAVELAKAHEEDDPQTTVVYLSTASTTRAPFGTEARSALRRMCLPGA